MPVFRTEKKRNYTKMSNYHLRDKNLSLKAKGLLSMMLSFPESWRYSVNGLEAISKEGVSSIRSALRELEANGYLIRKQERGTDGKMIASQYYIFEMPQNTPLSGNPSTVQPSAVKPKADTPSEGKQLGTIIDLTITERQTTDGKKKREKELARTVHGQYGNVMLSDTELQQLKTEFPSDYLKRIEALSEYMASSGKTYNNHLATIRRWAKNNSRKIAQGYNHENYQCKEEDSL